MNAARREEGGGMPSLFVPSAMHRVPYALLESTRDTCSLKYKTGFFILPLSFGRKRLKKIMPIACEEVKISPSDETFQIRGETGCSSCHRLFGIGKTFERYTKVIGKVFPPPGRHALRREPVNILRF